MHFTCRSFIGDSKLKSWSRFWENDPDDPFLKSTKGHLFALVNLNSNEEKDLNSIGHDINFEFNQTYFSPETSSDIFTNIKQSINFIINNPLYSEYKIDFIVAVVLNNQVYFGTFGNCKVIFKRQSQISILLNGLENQVDTLVGPIRSKDRFFLSTNAFFEKVTWQKIKQFISDSKIQNIEENFLTTIYSLDDQKDLNAAFIQVEPEDDEIVDDLPKEVEETQTNLETSSPTATENPIIESNKPKFNFVKIIQLIKKVKKNDSVFISHHETSETNKRKKLSLIFGIVLIIGLFLSIYFGYRKNQAQKIEREYQTLKTQVEKEIDNINKIKSLSIDEASQAANQTNLLVQKMATLQVHQDEVKNYDSQLKNILSQTGSDIGIAPDFLYDTKNIANNSQFQKLIFNDNKIYLLDSNNGRVDYFDINNKSTKSVLISEKIKSAINFTLDKTNLYLLNKDSISLFEKDNLTSKIDLTADSVSPTDFKFWNGAAYVLDSSNQTIWKYNPNSTGFSKAQNWLKNDAKLNIGAISLAINGQIWVLHQSGLVVPYSSGVKSNFKVSQASNFTKTNNLDVTLEKDLITFVDNENIIYVYQKTGELLSKYNLGNLKVLDLAFNEINNNIYILCSDQKIYLIKFQP